MIFAPACPDDRTGERGCGQVRFRANHVRRRAPENLGHAAAPRA